MPVLPEVASMMVLPGCSSPEISACSIIHRAVRSLIEPPGLLPSSLAQISTFGFGFNLRMRINGVLPIRANTPSRTGALLVPCFASSVMARPYHIRGRRS